MHKYPRLNLFSCARAVWLLLFIGGLGTTAFAQQTVSGVVTSEEGDPLIGVTVRVVDNLTTGTVTDIDGAYTITVPSAESALLFSYTGYANQTVAVGNQTKLDVTMANDAEVLEEVVVVGYGYVEKSDLTGSVTSVKSEDLTRVEAVNFEQGLAAQASGVQVVTSQGGPGAAAKIRIRGGTSISGSSDPLYVIDGFPITGGGASNSAGPGSTQESPLSTINPSDIESIEILKDASSTAIYGSRGANGVILITTKKGKEGRAQLTYNNSFNVGTLSRNIDILRPQEYVDFWNEYHPYRISTFENRDLSYRDDFGNNLNLGDSELRVVNWADRVFRNSFSQRHNVSVNGGSERGQYNASFGYQGNEGILEGSFFNRYSASLNVNQQLANGLSAGVNVNAGFVDRGGPVTAADQQGNTSRSSLITQILLFPNVQGRIRFQDAEYDEDGILESVRDGNVFNPELQIANTHNFGNTVNGYGNIYVQYAVNKEITIKSSFGGNYYNNNSEGVYPSDFGWSRTFNGLAFTNLFRSYGWLNENTISYNKKIGIHGINAVAGYTRQASINRSQSTSSEDFALPGVDIDAQQSARRTNPTNSNRFDWQLESWLGRINYTLMDKYLFTVSGRADGSSRFFLGEPWGFFPSAAVGWRVSEEPFMEGIDAISNLKLRATWGISGNNEIGSFLSWRQFEPTRAILDGSIVSGARLSAPGNDDLTWETTSQIDLGFELGLFNNRVSIDFDYYDKITSDLLLSVPVSPETGFTSILQNFGEVQNRGVEFNLNTTPVDKGDFTWNFRLNAARNQNTVNDIGDAEFILFNSPGQNTQDFIIRVGEPIGSFFGYRTDGVYNYDDFTEFDGLSVAEAAQSIRDRGGQFWNHRDYTLKEGVVTRDGVTDYRPGMVKLQDVGSIDENGNRVPIPDGKVNEADRVILGSVQPDVYGGITNDFSYKNFNLNFLFQFSIGNEVLNNNTDLGTSTAIETFNKLGRVRDRWTLDNPNSDEPSIWGYTHGGVNNEALDIYVEDGSFLRLANVTLGYSLPKGFATTSNARVFLAIDNAFLLSDYSGYDPEVSVGNNQVTPGVDSDSYPRQRTFRGGLSVTF